MSVDVNGDLLIVGAPYSQKAFVYKKDPAGSWKQSAELSLSDCNTCLSGYNEFGRSVGVTDGYAFVNVRFDDFTYSLVDKTLVFGYSNDPPTWSFISELGSQTSDGGRIIESEGNNILMVQEMYYDQNGYAFASSYLRKIDNQDIFNYTPEGFGFTYLRTSVHSPTPFWGDISNDGQRIIHFSDNFEDVPGAITKILTKDYSTSWNEETIPFNINFQYFPEALLSIDGDYAFAGNSLMKRDVTGNWDILQTYPNVSFASLQGNQMFLAYNSLKKIDLHELNSSGTWDLKGSVNFTAFSGSSFIYATDENQIVVASPTSKKVKVFSLSDFFTPQLFSNANGLTEIAPSDLLAYDYFGLSSSIDGNQAIVGASTERGTTLPTPGNIYGVHDRTGAAYILEQNTPGDWISKIKLEPADGQPYDAFGGSVEIKGDIALVGSKFNDEKGANTGAAYVYEKDELGYWYLSQKLLPSDGVDLNLFGYAVALQNETAVISAVYNSVNGVTRSGAAYVFEKDANGAWLETAKLQANDPGIDDHFGYKVAIDENLIIVSAMLEDEGGQDAGAVYVFEKQVSGSWVQKQKLLGSDAGYDDRFGSGIDIEGERILVGASRQDPFGINTGKAYIFEKSGSSWIEVATIVSNDGSAQRDFGNDLALDGNFAAIAAFRNSGDRGSIYLFERQSQAQWSQVQKIMPSSLDGSDFFAINLEMKDGKFISGASCDDDLAINAGKVYIFDLLKPELSLLYETEFLVNLSWKAVAGAESYVLERKIGNGSFMPLTDLIGNPILIPQSKLSHVDTLLEFGVTTSYRLFANLTSGMSLYSNVEELTQPNPILPLNLAFACYEQSSDLLRWNVYNPNSINVPYIFAQWWSNQRDTLIATPGNSHFMTVNNPQKNYTYGDDNITGIWWIDQQLLSGEPYDLVYKANLNIDCAQSRLKGEPSPQAANNLLNGILGRYMQSSWPEMQGGFAVNISPNPVTNILRVELTGEGNAHRIRLMNVKGQLIMERNYPAESMNHELEMGDLPKGVYLIEVSNGQQNIIKKIVK
jgi:hypothetical protein